MKNPVTGSDPVLRALALCGMAGPVIFTAVITVLSLRRPGYDQVSQLLSELGEIGAPDAGLMNLFGFAVFGVLLIAFAAGLHRVFGRERGGLTGPVLVGTAGLAFIAEGYFRCDQGCVPVTPAGSLHLLLGIVPLVAMVPALIILSLPMRRDPLWKGYWLYSLVTAVLAVIATSFFIGNAGIGGLSQRIIIGLFLLWEEVIAIRMFFLS